MTNNCVVRCWKTKKCGWSGEIEELAEVRRKDKSGVIDGCCPKCMAKTLVVDGQRLKFQFV